MVGLLPQTNAPAAEVDVLADAWDFKGRSAARSTTGRWGAAAMILVAELTTLGIAVNLVTYLTATMHVGNAEAVNVVTNFMLCLLGGFVADSFLGRYLTIAIFTAVQATGVTILTISTAAAGLRLATCAAEGGPSSSTCERASGVQLGVLYLALYLTALGTSGLKSSVSGFGSDQFDETDRGEKSQMMRFFNWFFFFISLGSLLAVTVLVYIQENLGRPWGYGACAAAIIAGLGVGGVQRYHAWVVPTSSVLDPGARRVPHNMEMVGSRVGGVPQYPISMETINSSSALHDAYDMDQVEEEEDVDAGGREQEACLEMPPRAALLQDDERSGFHQATLQSLLGGIVPLCLSTLQEIGKANDFPDPIKLIAFGGLALVTACTLAALMRKKRAKAAVRVAASASIAAITVAAVAQVAEKEGYSKFIIGVTGTSLVFATVFF